MQVDVEFYGIPRQRAGVDVVSVELRSAHATLADVLRELARRFPCLASDCVSLADGTLRPSVVASLNGDRFVSSPETLLPAGVPLLILSADAGG